MESQIMEWSQGMGKRLKEYFRSRESRRRMSGEWDAAISVGATLFMVTVRKKRNIFSPAKGKPHLLRLFVVQEKTDSATGNCSGS